MRMYIDPEKVSVSETNTPMTYKICYPGTKNEFYFEASNADNAKQKFVETVLWVDDEA